jgi:hypothetical protein
MDLDINTPKGQESLAQERKLLEAFSSSMGWQIIETDKEQPAQVDGFLVENKTIVGVFEAKCRKATIKQMENWGSEWLLTHQKLLDGIEISRRLRVPFYGLIYLLNDGVGVYIKLTDNTGTLLPEVKIRVENTETQATINGGKVVRANAYIDLSTSYIFAVRE